MGDVSTRKDTPSTAACTLESPMPCVYPAGHGRTAIVPSEEPLEPTKQEELRSARALNQSHAHCEYVSSGRLTMEAPVARADEPMADCSPTELFELPCDDIYKTKHYPESRLEYADCRQE